jgi:hypothetical protein
LFGVGGNSSAILDDVAAWTSKIAAAFHSFQRAASRTFRRKVKSTPFPEKNRGVPFNASGVVQVGPRRFVFVDNHDSSALFEFVLDADGAEVDGIRRRPLVGVAEGQLGDPEGLTRVDVDGETFLIAASSLCITGGKVNDGLVRVRYTPEGDLHAEAMNGFRTWLLTHEPSLAGPGAREPDAGGLNIEGLAWDPRANALLFGQRGPAEPGRISMIRSPSMPALPRGRRRRSARHLLCLPAHRNRRRRRGSGTSPTTSRPETS